MKIKIPYFFALIFLAQVSSAWAWSSTRIVGDAFATHEFMNEEAFREFSQHPAFKYYDFPSLDEIQDNSGVNADKSGGGPDNPQNSYYSYHWYNPYTGKGKAPGVAQDYYERLGNLFQKEKPTEGKIILEDDDFTTGHSVAYLAHYVQDMTCSFHVVGMPAEDVDINKVGSNAAIGPFRQYDNAAWRWVVGKFRQARVQDVKTDWFDPSYWDGQELLGSVGSSHFMYEGLVEVAYKRTLSRAWIDERKAKEGMISPLWPNTAPKDEVARDFAKRVALQTRNFLKTGENGANIDTVAFQKALEINANTFAYGIKDQTLSLVKNFINIPYDDWWRGIQATYTVWRASICALCVDATNLCFARIPDSHGKYELRISVHNLENETADEVKVSYELQGGISAQGEGSFDSIEASSNKMKTLSGTFELKEEDRAKSKLIIKITGKYQKTPDAGLFIRVFDASRIRVVEYKMPRLTMKFKDEALKIAQGDPYEFKVKVESLGDAKTKLDANVVEEQEPATDTIVAGGESVTIKVFGNYTATVPMVIGMTKQQAVNAIVGADLTPAPTDIEVPEDQPEGIVMEQSPGKDARVKPGSEVTISVSKRLVPEKQPEATPVAQPTAAPTAANATQPDKEPEPPLRELQVSPGGAELEVGQAVELTAIPIALFPEQPITPQIVAGMSFQWVANLPGLVSISGNGNTASVAAYKAGEVNIMAITDQAMGIATLIIKDPNNTTGTNSAGAGAGAGSGGFQDSSNNWQSQDNDADNTVPEVPPPPQDQQPSGGSPYSNNQQPANGPQGYDANSAALDSYFQQQQAYDQQQQQQQAFEEQQRQMALMNAFGNILGNAISQMQGINNNQNNNFNAFNNYNNNNNVVHTSPATLDKSSSSHSTGAAGVGPRWQSPTQVTPTKRKVQVDTDAVNLVGAKVKHAVVVGGQSSSSSSDNGFDGHYVDDHAISGDSK